MRKRKSPVLYIFAGGLLLNLFLPSYSYLHIYIALSYCFFRTAKKNPAGRKQQNQCRLVFLFLNIKQLCAVLLSTN